MASATSTNSTSTSTHYPGGRKKCGEVAGGGMVPVPSLHPGTRHQTHGGKNGEQVFTLHVNGEQASTGSKTNWGRARRSTQRNVGITPGTSRKKNSQKHHSQQTNANNRRLRLPPLLAFPNFNDPRKVSKDQKGLQRVVSIMAPLLVQAWRVSPFGERHVKRTATSRKEYSIQQAAQEILTYVLKWTEPRIILEQLIEQTAPISPAVMSAVCHYGGQAGLRMDAESGAKNSNGKRNKNSEGLSGSFAQATATFSQGFGTSKGMQLKGSRRIQKSQALSMKFPICHMLMFRYFQTQLPDHFTKYLLLKPAYVSCLCNSFTKIHGGSMKEERKIHLENGWNTAVSHIGSGHSFNFLSQLTPEEVDAVGNIGQMGAPLSIGADAPTVEVSCYVYGQPVGTRKVGGESVEYNAIPADLQHHGSTLPASEMYHVSAQNVVVLHSTKRLHGAGPCFLAPTLNVNPCKWTLVFGVGVAGTEGWKNWSKSEPHNALAVFSNGQRLTTAARPPPQKVQRIKYDEATTMYLELTPAAIEKGNKRHGTSDYMLKGHK